MPRRRKRGRVRFRFGRVCFKPCGIPANTLDRVTLSYDELEAIRLADFEGLYQQQASELMQVSRPTFSRIIERAHQKIADALIHSKAIEIEEEGEFPE
ncbi:DUF134 domain-containing protein [Hippea maritima]|uniref:UPF0251 protein Hipma_0379 n=1 Tax=Hippea maritima (strain ATCC 700847 / DSM 10411 / MH2) TaxID=760142 RepID=F2LTN0_HIPMA|nr:DUF134 domain-containing protein [Hippea maritima]AEA33355.1 UPF0251 protein [Hippea maritima DSM 10411]